MARKPMTPEQRAANAERLRKAKEAKAAERTAEAEKMAGTEAEIETDAEVEAQAQPEAEDEGKNDGTVQEDKVAQLEEMVRRLQEQLANRDPQIIQVMNDGEKVVMRFQSECADDNLAIFGPNGMYGQVTGKVGRVVVPKSEWSRFYTSEMRYLLDTRQLIVLSGMSEDEREAYGVNYRPGEVLDEKAFRKLVDLGDELLVIYPKLCLAHKEMIARRFIDAYMQGNPKAHDRALVTALNELSKPDYANLPAKDPRRLGAFYPVIEMMNEKEAQV